MTIVKVGTTDFFSTSGDGFTSSGIDTTGANFIVIALACAAGTGTITDNKSNTWIPLTEYQGFFGTRALKIIYAYNANVGTGHTFTVGGASGLSPALAMAWYSGVKYDANPFDAGKDIGSNNDSSATIAAGSLTPSTDNSLVITALYKDGSFSSAPTVNGGFTSEAYTSDTGFGHFSAALGDLIQTTATAANPTWTTASDIVIAASAVFKMGTPPPPGVDTDIRSRRTLRPGVFKPMGDAFRTGQYRGWR